MTLKTFQVWWESTLLEAVFRSGYKIYLPFGSGFGSLLYKNSLKGKTFKCFHEALMHLSEMFGI